MATGRVNVGGGGARLNIFTQLTAPSVKEGIWLQTADKYSKVINDTNFFLGGKWASPGLYLQIPSDFNYRGDVVPIDTNIYLFAVSNNRINVSKYDTLTNTYTRLSDVSNNDYGRIVVVGTDIYLIGKGRHTGTYIDSFIKYDTLSDTFTVLRPLPYSFGNGSAAVVGTDIYMFGFNSSSGVNPKAYKYDTLTDIFTEVGQSPTSLLSSSAVSIATDIYIFGLRSSVLAYKFDTLTNTFSQLSDIPATPSPTGYYPITAVGMSVYLVVPTSTGNGLLYEYNVLEDTYTQLDSPLLKFTEGGATFITDKIYLFDRYKNLQVFNFDVKQYADGTLLLFRSSDFFGKYYTELVSPVIPIEGNRFTRITTGFDNVWLFNKGKIQEYPSYYGDGSKWIKFKN